MCLLRLACCCSLASVLVFYLAWWFMNFVRGRCKRPLRHNLVVRLHKYCGNRQNMSLTTFCTFRFSLPQDSFWRLAKRRTIDRRSPVSGCAFKIWEWCTQKYHSIGNTKYNVVHYLLLPSLINQHRITHINIQWLPSAACRTSITVGHEWLNEWMRV